jgi:hypothetical protein
MTTLMPFLDKPGELTSSPKDQSVDLTCLEIIDENPNMMIPWYLLSAYAYYEEDDPILSDRMFDRLSQDILKRWDTIDHYHKEFLTKGDLEAGTFMGKYPSRIQGALLQLRSVHIDKFSKKGKNKT